MINEKGERVAGPKRPEIPPHMLEGMTSAGQKRVLAKWKRAEPSPTQATPAKASAKKSSAKRSGKRSAKKASK